MEMFKKVIEIPYKLSLKMAEHIPKWLMEKYAKLWQKKKDNPFTLNDYLKILKDEKKIALVVLSRLRKHGWMKVEFDPKDTRRRIYTLIDPKKVIEKIH